jgi:hypothetical protein
MADESSEQKTEKARLFWQNVLRFKRECFSQNQPKRPSLPAPVEVLRAERGTAGAIQHSVELA